MTCKCTFAQHVVGDGCEECNPHLALNLLRQRISDLETERDEALSLLQCVAELVRKYRTVEDSQ
jgi:hypothetical protein